MDDDKKDEESEVPPINPEKEKMVETGDQKYKCQLEEAGLGEKLDRILSMIEEIHAWEKSEHEDEEGIGDMGEMGEPSEPMGQEENDMNNPSSVAFQDNNSYIKKFMGGMTKAVKEMSQRIIKLEHQKMTASTEEKLKKFCQGNGLNFQEYLHKLRKYSSVADRETFLEALETFQLANKSPQRHPATGMAQKFATKTPTQNMTAEDNAVSKFSAAQQPTARRAYQIFQDVVIQQNAKARKFQQAWQSPETFIKYATENPQILDDMEEK